jgi:hypothetical protein
LAILDPIKRAWNAFRTPQASVQNEIYGGSTWYGGRSPSRAPAQYFSDRTILASIYTKLAVDVADIPIKHVQADDQKRYLSDMDSSLNACLTLQPNIDQGPRAFRQDIATTLFDSGCAVIVPINTSVNPNGNEAFQIFDMRIGEVAAWHPTKVRVNVYNELKGEREEILIDKSSVAIIENPFYPVMNAPNSTLQRLTRKLCLLDAIDEQSASGNLDLIIQLPYVVKSDSQRIRAEQRRQDIEVQLKDSQYGIAYTDGTEKITQLNRPAENNLLKQIEYLTKLLYNQLGLTEEVMDGTADEEAMSNYFHRTIKPIVDSIVEAMQRSFLGFSGTRANQRIMYFRDAFKFISIKDIAEIVDKFTRNEVATANEMRAAIGLPPSKEPKADKLQNSNMPSSEVITDNGDSEGDRQNGM